MAMSKLKSIKEKIDARIGNKKWKEVTEEDLNYWRARPLYARRLGTKTYYIYYGKGKYAIFIYDRVNKTWEGKGPYKTYEEAFRNL
jgi:hypothetical protein